VATPGFQEIFDMPFDVNGARKAGYSDAEIADYLAKDQKFDAAGARKAGYSDAEIVSHLSSAAVPAPASSPKPGATPYETQRRQIMDRQAASFPSIQQDRATLWGSTKRGAQGLKTTADLLPYALEQTARRIVGDEAVGRTSTGKIGRGKGLAQMAEWIRDSGSGSLRIMSGKGALTYLPGSRPVRRNLPVEFCGTLVEWEVRLDA
jgi:hypothetical protein